MVDTHLMVLALSSLAAAGCVMDPPEGAPASSGFDAQGCLEASLRGHPAEEISVESVPLFRQHCSAGNGPACSALGVAHELGIGGARDLPAAVAAYRRACDLGNARGCTNLGALLETGELGKSDPSAADALFESACKAGERSGCAQLGRAYRDGSGVERDIERAQGLLNEACGSGETPACLDLADMLAVSSPATALPLYVRTCLAGLSVACSKVDRPPG